MNESKFPPTPSENDPAPPQPPAAPPQEPPAPAGPGSDPGGAFGLGRGPHHRHVAGVILILISVGLLGVGGVAVWAGFQRDGGYVTTDVQEFSASGSALATDPVDLGSEGVSWVYSSDFLDSVRIRVTPTTSDQQLFVGIGRSAAVSGYLARVSRTVISDFWGDDVKAVPGGTPESPPGEQDFWVASTHGSGHKLCLGPVRRNLDGSGHECRWPTRARRQSRPRRPDTPPGVVCPRLPAGRGIVLAGGVLLIVLAIRRRRPVQAQAV